jgi:hypothetical protein
MIIARDHRPSYVYGLFVNDRCIYVGQTCHPTRRAANHSSRFQKILGLTPKLKVLFTSRDGNANGHETATIKKYRDRGQAEFNRNGNGAAPRRGSILFRGQAVYCVDTGETFLSKVHLGHALSCSAAKVTSILRQGGKHKGLKFIDAALSPDRKRITEPCVFDRVRNSAQKRKARRKANTQ